MKSELDSSNHQKESTGTTRRALLERSALAIGSGVLAAAIPSGTAASPAETATTVGAEAFAANHELEPLPFDASKLQGLSKRGETAMGSLAGNVSSNASQIPVDLVTRALSHRKVARNGLSSSLDTDAPSRHRPDRASI